MKKETIEKIAARIAQLEVRETHLAQTTQFPPPGCRNVAVWKQVQGDTLVCVRQSLVEQREILALMRGQLKFDFDH